MKPAGIVVAGGEARRLGGIHKTLCIVAGRPILTRIVERMRPQLSVLTLNVTGDEAQFASWELPIVADPVGERRGPLSGILAGLEWLALNHPGIPELLSVPGDTPFLPRDLAYRLQSRRNDCRAEIVLAASSGRLHPVIGIWPTRLRHDLRQALLEQGLRKVGDFADRYRLAVAEFSAGDVDPFFNVNYPEDLAEADAIAKAESAQPLECHSAAEQGNDQV